MQLHLHRLQLVLEQLQCGDRLGNPRDLNKLPQRRMPARQTVVTQEALSNSTEDSAN